MEEGEIDERLDIAAELEKDDMTYLEYAEKFLEEHDNDDKWSPFDRLEVYAIRLFAKWLDQQKIK